MHIAYSLLHIEFIIGSGYQNIIKRIIYLLYHYLVDGVFKLCSSNTNRSPPLLSYARCMNSFGGIINLSS